MTTEPNDTLSAGDSDRTTWKTIRDTLSNDDQPLDNTTLYKTILLSFLSLETLAVVDTGDVPPDGTSQHAGAFSVFISKSSKPDDAMQETVAQLVSISRDVYNTKPVERKTVYNLSLSMERMELPSLQGDQCYIIVSFWK